MWKTTWLLWEMTDPIVNCAVPQKFKASWGLGKVCKHRKEQWEHPFKPVQVLEKAEKKRGIKSCAGQTGFSCGSKVKYKVEGQKADQKQKLQDRASMSWAWWSLLLVKSWHMTLFSLPSLSSLVLHMAIILLASSASELPPTICLLLPCRLHLYSNLQYGRHLRMKYRRVLQRVIKAHGWWNARWPNFEWFPVCMVKSEWSIADGFYCRHLYIQRPLLWKCCRSCVRASWIVGTSTEANEFQIQSPVISSHQTVKICPQKEQDFVTYAFFVSGINHYWSYTATIAHCILFHCICTKCGEVWVIIAPPSSSSSCMIWISLNKSSWVTWWYVSRFQTVSPCVDIPNILMMIFWLCSGDHVHHGMVL